MKALVLNCTLKPSPETSSTEALAQVVIDELEKGGAEVEMVRLVDLNIKPGVKTDQGAGDDWPAVHDKIMAANIVVFATPTWVGQMSSVCMRALERMDALFEETDDSGRPVAFGKVGGIVITGNEDGAHHIVATVSQALIDMGFTMAAQSWTYWHLGPGPGPDYVETDDGHDYSDRVGRNAARNLLSLAKVLKPDTYPVPESGEQD
ncbi:flavodoxin family protein [Brevundimonas mediterranea]|uniref:Multimeric flavodoxin WrbA n=1 Tax=Brevundimonas mediterranea TaxID=74329 RepID=A0A7W6A0H4_9CAUL|nr:flavodoxin family protein [Brevundimonas mediterranea]MBB3870974.1 multimeric flavodoxin WrbA [Brevundimonas mediterranea]